MPRTDTTTLPSLRKRCRGKQRKRKTESSGEAESHPSTVEKVISLSCSSRYRYDNSIRQTPQLQLGLTRIALQSPLLILNWLQKETLPVKEVSPNSIFRQLWESIMDDSDYDEGLWDGKDIIVMVRGCNS